MTDLYTPLDIESYQIRIIHLLPGDNDSIIQCELKRYPLVSPPKYIALSYCWGDEAIKRSIMVNNIEVMVTINLHQALQRLRDEKVELVWADALCINQADDQEKSLQVRNMKQVYAKAEATYAWLGGPEHDKAAFALSFLCHLPSHPELLTDMPHRSKSLVKDDMQLVVSNSRNDMPAGIAPLQQNFCMRCKVEAAFQGLIGLCERPYWRRRWVIQEVTTATRSRIICGKQMIDLDDMADALQRCSSSSYWQPPHTTASLFIQKILDFRKSYHNGQSLKLCGTILTTKDSLSKDARDKAYALIGICTDGAQLIPTPSYHQSIEHVTLDLTREVLRRNAGFDLILVDQRSRSDAPSTLPTWCPDWFSEHLSEDAQIMAEEQPYLARSYGTQSVRGNSNELHVQGFEFGTVVRHTSVLSFPTLSTTTHSSSPGEVTSINPSASEYYGRYTLAALLTCLLASNTTIEGPITTRSSVHLHFLLQILGDSVNRGSSEHNEVRQVQKPWAIFPQWLSQNAGFSIHGRNLQDWLRESRVRYYTDMPHAIFDRKILITSSIFATYLLLFAAALLFKTGARDLMLLFYGVVPSLCPFYIGYFAYGTHCMNRNVRRNIEQALETFLLPSARLILLDNGALGMASVDVQIGDKVCLIAGCTTAAAVLRERTAADQTAYTVVGKSKICLSNEDEDRYRAFSRTAYPEPERQPQDVWPGILPRPAIACSNLMAYLKWRWKCLSKFEQRQKGELDFPLMDVKEYNRLIEEYKERSGWKRFVLV